MKKYIESLDEFIDVQKDIELSEMADILHTERFGKLIGIPMNIWLDDDKFYLKSGHGKRTKFQRDTNPRMADIGNLASISTVDYKIYKGRKEIDIADIPKDKDFKVQKKDIEKVIAFMKKYPTAIDLLMYKEIDYDTFEDYVPIHKNSSYVKNNCDIFVKI